MKFLTHFLPTVVQHKTEGLVVPQPTCLEGVSALLNNFTDSSLTLDEAENNVIALLEYRDLGPLSEEATSHLAQQASVTPFIKVRLMLCDL